MLHSQFPYLLLTFERITSQVRCTPGKDPEGEPPMFDAEHETKRKEQLLKLYNRTPEQVRTFFFYSLPCVLLGANLLLEI